MPGIVVSDRDGASRTIDVVPGRSLMEVIRDAGMDALMALCDGCCSCATCHIYVDPAFANVMSPVSQDEDDLLDSTDYRQETSRLACQITFTDALDGMHVSIAPEG